jgi:hypothetical protein
VSTHRPEWHVADPDLVEYAAGTVGVVPAASIETHLLACPRCRAQLGRVGGDEREEAWARLADAIDHPSPTLLERVTRRHHLARSAIATPVMVRAALVAVALVGIIPLLAAFVASDAAPLVLLVVAPLAPVAAVALAYRDWSDPAGEITLATPTAGIRLVAMRAVVVALSALVLAVVALLVAELWVDVSTRLAFAWCLPGLALAALVMLAGTTRIDPLPVAIGLSLAWAATVLLGATARRSLRYEALLDLVASPAAQMAALTVAVAAIALTVVRRDAVSYRRIA